MPKMYTREKEEEEGHHHQEVSQKGDGEEGTAGPMS